MIWSISIAWSCWGWMFWQYKCLRSLAPSIFTLKCAHVCGEYIFCWAMQNGRLCLIASNMATPWRKAIWWNMQKQLTWRCCWHLSFSEIQTELANSVKIKNPLNISVLKLLIFISFWNALNLHWEHFEFSLMGLV